MDLDVVSVEAHVDIQEWRTAAGVGDGPIVFAAGAADLETVDVLLRKTLQACSKKAKTGLPGRKDAELADPDGRPLLDAGIASLREEQGGSTLAVVLQRAGDPEGLNITTKRKLETSAAFITSHTSGKDVAPLHLFTEFLDNALKALKDAPAAAPKVIDTYVLQERLDGGGDFAGLLVRDSGVGMGQSDMDRWRKRGSMPMRSNEEAIHDDVEGLAAAELRRAFLIDSDLSTFGRGASEAGFALGREVAIVAKLAGSSKVWELVGTNKGTNQFWDSVSIESRGRLEQTAANIEAGVWAQAWQDSSVLRIPGADRSQHLPRLMHFMESFGTSEGAEGDAPPDSFAYVLVANLNEESTEEVPRAEILRNFNRVANHIKAIYFYFLGCGPYHGRFFGGSMPFDPFLGTPRSLEEALERTTLLQGAGMTPPQPLNSAGKPMSVRLHVFFKCEPDGSADWQRRVSSRDAGLFGDWLACASGLRPELAQCLREGGERPHASSFRHRCLNDLPYEGWPLRGPQSAEEAAREDALSRRLRVTLQRPMLLATQASNVAALSAADRKAAVSQLGALHGFACAARNEGWAKGNLPIVFQLQYVPRECGRSTISQLTGAGLSELQDLARLGRTSEWVQVIGHTTRALLPRENDRLTIHWNGRLVGERCLPEQKGRPLLPFMQLDTDGKRGHPCTDLLAKHFPDQVSAMDPVFDEDAPRSLKELKDLNKRLNAALLDLSNSCVTGGVFVTDLKVHHEKDVAAGKFSRAASQGGERSAQNSYVKHKAMESFATCDVKDKDKFLAYYSSPGKTYDDLHFAKEFVPYSGRRGGYQDVPVGKLSQLECLSVDWFLWAATCSARLDVKLELSGEWPALRLAKSDQVVYKECFDGVTTFVRGDFFCADLAALNKRQTVYGGRTALKQYVVIEGFVRDTAPPHRPQVVGRRVFRSKDCEHRNARSLKSFEGLLEPLVLLDAVYGTLLARNGCVEAPKEVLEYIEKTYMPAIPRGIICGLARHLDPAKDRDGTFTATPGFPSPKANWQSQHLEHFWIVLVPSLGTSGKEGWVTSCVEFVAPVAAMNPVVIARKAVEPAGGRGGAGPSNGTRPGSAALEATVPATKLGDAITSQADRFHVAVQLQRQVGALWEAVLDVDERPISIDATLSPISCPKSFQPPLSDESRLYRIAMPREVPQLEPGKYRFAVTVTHTLLTRRAQQSATRQQAPVVDEDALATSYLPIQSVRVCEYQSPAQAARRQLKISALEHPHATDASTAVPFVLKSGEPATLVCAGLKHADEVTILGMTAAKGFANSQEEPRLQLVLLAVDRNGMHCGGAAALRFVREHIGDCKCSLKWPPSSAISDSGDAAMPFEVYIPPAAKLRTVDNAVHVPAFIFCRDRDALDHDALRTRLPWLAPPAQAQKPITLHLSVSTSDGIARGQRVPLKLLPGFPAACHVARCPERLTNGSEVPRQERIVVMLLDSCGLPASTALSSDGPAGWPFTRPTLSLSALGHTIVDVGADVRDPADAWDVKKSNSMLTLKLPLRHAPLSAEDWAEHREAVPCQLNIELLEGTFSEGSDPAWAPVDAPIMLHADGTMIAQPMGHLLPEEPPVLVPSEQPASLRVVLTSRSNTEIVANTDDGPLQRWTLRCPAGSGASGVGVEVRTETGAVIEPGNPKLALVTKTPRVSAGPTAKRNLSTQQVSGLVAPLQADALPNEATFAVRYANKEVPGLALLIQVLARPRPAARWALDAKVVGDGAAPAQIALSVWRLDSGGGFSSDPLADPAADLPDVVARVQEGRNMAAWWPEGTLPDLLQESEVVLQLRERNDVTEDNARYLHAGLLVAAEVPDGRETSISFLARSAPRSGQELEESAACEVIVRPGLLASVKKEMAGLPRVSYRNLALPAMTLTFVDRWSSPTCKLTEDGTVPEYWLDVELKGKSPAVEVEHYLPAPRLQRDSHQVGTPATWMRLANGEAEMRNKVSVKLRVTVARAAVGGNEQGADVWFPAVPRLGETLAEPVAVPQALQLQCAGQVEAKIVAQGYAMTAPDKAVCLASGAGTLEVVALPVIGNDALATLEHDDGLCDRMRLAFPRRLPDRVVTATVKREPIDIPNATANVSRQHAKLSVPLPTSQPVEYSLTVTYREPDADIAPCLPFTEREAVGTLKLAVVNAAAHRVAVEVAELQGGVPALDNSGTATLKVRLSAQDAFGNELCGKSPVAIPEALRDGEAAHELSQLLPIEAQLLPDAAPDKPIRLVADKPSGASVHHRATTLPITLHVAEPASAGLGLTGSCRLVLHTRAGALPEGACPVTAAQQIRWTDVKALAAAEELRRQEELAEMQRRAEERLRVGVAASKLRVQEATAHCQRIEAALGTEVLPPLWRQFLAALAANEARELREHAVGTLPSTDIGRLTPVELANMCQRRSGKSFQALMQQYHESAQQRGTAELSSAVRDGDAVIRANSVPGMRHLGVAAELVEINPQAVGRLQTTDAHLRNLVARFLSDDLNQALLWDRGDMTSYQGVLRACRNRGSMPQPTKANAMKEYVRGQRHVRPSNPPRGFVAAQEVLQASAVLRQRAAQVLDGLEDLRQDDARRLCDLVPRLVAGGILFHPGTQQQAGHDMGRNTAPCICVADGTKMSASGAVDFDTRRTLAPGQELPRGAFNLPAIAASGLSAGQLQWLLDCFNLTKFLVRCVDDVKEVLGRIGTEEARAAAGDPQPESVPDCAQVANVANALSDAVRLELQQQQHSPDVVRLAKAASEPLFHAIRALYNGGAAAPQAGGPAHVPRAGPAPVRHGAGPPQNGVGAHGAQPAMPVLAGGRGGRGRGAAGAGRGRGPFGGRGAIPPAPAPVQGPAAAAAKRGALPADGPGGKRARRG